MKPIPIDVATRTFRHGSLRGYAVGLAVSLLLTVASFGAVSTGLVPPGSTLGAIVALCVLQLLVQLGFFLHLGTGSEQRGNTGIFACTALLIAIIVAGSLWVTHNANANMMPASLSVQGAMSKD